MLWVVFSNFNHIFSLFFFIHFLVNMKFNIYIQWCRTQKGKPYVWRFQSLLIVSKFMEIYAYHTTAHHTTPQHTTPHHTILCHTMPHHTIPYHTIPYHAIPYHTIPFHTRYHNYNGSIFLLLKIHATLNTNSKIFKFWKEIVSTCIDYWVYVLVSKTR